MTDTNTDVLKGLKDLILKLLGAEGLNTLGQYEVFENNKKISEIPSISIGYPYEKKPISKRMKKYSGINAIIWEEPDIVPKLYQSYGLQITDYYTVTLDNHHPHNGLRESVNELLKTRMIDQDGVRIKPAIVTPKGITPARAMLFFKLINFESPYNFL